MTQTTWTEPKTGPGSSSGSSGDFARQERRAAEDLVDDAKVAASETGEQARKLASEKAEELQGAAASHLRTFADAVRAAGDELADKEPGPVSDLVRQAAEGLEQFSGALGRKSSSEMLDSVRDFGRQNPVGFLAGTMLAGFALARFAGSDAPQPNGGSAHHDDAHRPAGAPGASTGFGQSAKRRQAECPACSELRHRSPERRRVPVHRNGTEQVEDRSMSTAEERVDQRPVGGLLTDLVSQMNALFRTEISLLKSEMKDNVRSFRGALVSVAIGAALMIAGLVVLVQAAVAGMVAAGMSVWMASALVGVVVGIIGWIVIKQGADKMSPSEMTPERTVHQMEKDVALVKEKAK
jgi:hypothetical protein